jgi:formylglycine-generating enzyme required for sulfatase activity
MNLETERASGGLVTLSDFAAFLRGDDGYFAHDNWPESFRRGSQEGDAILARLGFRWDLREHPVRGVTWFEAAAYCRWRAGRLPYAAELEASGGRTPEWCADWLNRGDAGGGPDGRPDDRGLRRVLHHDQAGLRPEYHEARVGFRVAWGEARIGPRRPGRGR